MFIWKNIYQQTHIIDEPFHKYVYFILFETGGPVLFSSGTEKKRHFKTNTAG
jgi:hypothetical protein